MIRSFQDLLPGGGAPGSVQNRVWTWVWEAMPLEESKHSASSLSASSTSTILRDGRAVKWKKERRHRGMGNDNELVIYSYYAASERQGG